MTSTNGLHEPLIERTTTRNRNAGTRDLEIGTVQFDDDEVPVAQTPRTFPPIKRPYRAAATVAASIDLLGTVAIAWYLEGWKCVWPIHSSTKYTMANSIVDIVWIALARSVSVLSFDSIVYMCVAPRQQNSGIHIFIISPFSHRQAMLRCGTRIRNRIFQWY